MQATQRTQAGALYGNRLNKREAAVLDRAAMQVQCVTWDFSSDGGAVGDIDFGVDLPADATVTRIFAEELTNVTSGGAATLQLKAGSTALSGAEAIAGFAGITQPALAGSVAGIRVSAASRLKMAIATAAATAGKVRFSVEFFVSK